MSMRTTYQPIVRRSTVHVTPARRRAHARARFVAVWSDRFERYDVELGSVGGLFAGVVITLGMVVGALYQRGLI